MEESDIVDQFIDGKTTKEQLKNAKEIIKSFESEVFKLRVQLKKAENSLKKIQDFSAVNSQNLNNTSSAFMLPSEFKKLWESLVLEDTLDLFSPFLPSHMDFFQLIKTLIQVIVKNTESQLKFKLESVSNLLGITDTNKENIKKYMLKLFQDNYCSSFPTPSTKIIETAFLEAISSGLKEKAITISESSDFPSFIEKMHKISVFMLLNDPIIELKFEEQAEIICISKPDDYYLIDGFPVDNSSAIIVIPAVFKNNQPFGGIKPSVIILSEENIKEISQNEKTEDSNDFQSIRYSLDFSEENFDPLRTPNNDKSKHCKNCEQCDSQNICEECSKNLIYTLAKRMPKILTPQKRKINLKYNRSFEYFNQKDNKSLMKKLNEAASKMSKNCVVKGKYLDKRKYKL